MGAHHPNRLLPADTRRRQETITRFIAGHRHNITGDAGELYRLAETTGIVDIGMEDIRRFLSAGKHIRIACGRSKHSMDAALQGALQGLGSSGQESVRQAIVHIQTHPETPATLPQIDSLCRCMASLYSNVPLIWGISPDTTLPRGMAKVSIFLSA